MAQDRQPKLIDTMVHYNGEPGVLQKVLDKMTQVGGLAILCVTPQHIEEARAFIRKHPDRFIGFGEVNLDDPDILQQVDRLHREGFLGLGELSSTKKNYDDHAYWPIYARAQRYHMILHFHTGVVLREDPQKPEDVGFDRMRAGRLDLIARKFPGLVLIGAHLGNPDYTEAAEIARWDPNLYFDLSGSTLIKMKDNYAYFKSVFWWTGVESLHTPASRGSAFEKLVFASDVFNGDIGEFDLELARYHAMLDACGVPENSQKMIFSGTMWKILQDQKAAMTRDKTNGHAM